MHQSLTSFASVGRGLGRTSTSSSSRSRRVIWATKSQVRNYGFGDFHSSEALPGALPTRQFAPQRPPYGLFPELVSGTSFTAPRAHNQYTWMYRIRPSVVHDPGKDLTATDVANRRWTVKPAVSPVPPLQFRFPRVEVDPTLGLKDPVDFVDGQTTIAVNGCADMQTGAAAGVYTCSKSMNKRVLRNHDADMLIIPQEGALIIKTELGELEVKPQKFCLIPRGLSVQVRLKSEGNTCRGYVLENFGSPFVLPELGPIGISSGLAHPKYFTPPVAQFEDVEEKTEYIVKFQDNFFRGESNYSPFDVVAYYGSHVPVVFDLRDFMAINTVSHDHPDPSIGCVMSSYTTAPGIANIDFVVFPPRYVVAENTFRPPWFHRNWMSEFMGLIQGSYDAKTGFVPGATSIHNQFVPHGPDRDTVETGYADESPAARGEPERYNNALAFMWESNRIWRPTEFAMQIRDLDYRLCWAGIKKRFDAYNEPPHPQLRPSESRISRSWDD
ncbi:unnamed protein product [Amoebophrya sp. A25]|nr:unnamed protein product [Amoebophrya sp. A25]|eukprot:GSA25T00018978001.1